MDEFDDKAIHLLLHYLPTNEFMGCARLVRPLPNQADGRLPFEHVCRDVMHPEYMEKFASQRDSIAEVSRLAVESKFRRRRGERRSPAPISAHDFGDDLRPRFPYLVLGLYLGIVAAAQAKRIKSLFLLSEPRLATHFARLGVAVTRVGGEVEHRGTRVPSHMDVDSVVEGMSPFLRPLYDEVAQEVGFALEGER
jgi:N-acyl amino acid synthase of PEP-CTERM/exosortase system